MISHNQDRDGAGNRNSLIQNEIRLRYLNQNGKLISAGTIPGHRIGEKIDVTNAQHGGIEVPAGYLLEKKQSTHFIFGKHSQDVTLLIHGKNVNSKLNVHININTGKGHSVHRIKQVTYSRRIGDQFIISPNKYVPKGCYIDPVSHNARVRVTERGFMPSDVSFVYDREEVGSTSLGKVIVHYQDVDNLGQDLSSIAVHNYIGKPFKIKTYQKNIPVGYSFVKLAKGVSQFRKIPQDVVVLLRKYVHATLEFRDARDNHLIDRRPLLAHHPGATIHYHVLKKYIPSGYHFVNLGRHSTTLHSKDIDVIKVTRGGSDSNFAMGKIVINYLYNNQLINTRVVSGRVGSLFRIEDYETTQNGLPKGYQVLNVSGNFGRFYNGIVQVSVHLIKKRI